jgi:hypothetical protein
VSRATAAKTGAVSVALAGALLVGVAPEAEAFRAKAPPAAELAFRASVDPESGQKFRLSADYPRQNPGDCPECTWLKIPVNFDFQADPKPSRDDWRKGRWDAYIASILDYVRQGQDPGLRDEIGFRTQVAGATRWFNVPWMAYDKTAGREWRHGTTNERTASLEDLVGDDLAGVHDGAVHFLPKMSATCKARFPNGFETWSVGYYNPQGGYAIGKAIPRTGVPKVVEYMGSPMPDGLPFPQGTAVMKVLTTNAPPDCVPFLKDSPVWRVNRHVMNPATKKYMCQRQVQESRIVQIDVAVTDSRSPTGWVYGTFAYDGTRPGATFWDRLVPMGVQWGADPWSFPAVPRSASMPLQQSVANPDIKIYEHMGCGGRLAGPVDNPKSSCMSCHSSAYAAKAGTKSVMGVNVPPSFGFAGLCQAYSADNAAYFQNPVPPQSYASGQYPNAMSLDTSLQLEVAFQQYGQYATDGAPEACTLDSSK